VPSFLQQLVCASGEHFLGADVAAGLCPECGRSLIAKYDLESYRESHAPDSWSVGSTSIWRYFELLPLRRRENIVTLGEGGSPVLSLEPPPEANGIRLSLKDDGILPTGSFKARGMSVAVSRALEGGRTSLFVPSAGNAGVALAAYGARGRAKVRVYLPRSTPAPLQAAISEFGAELVKVSGTIADAGRVGRLRESGTDSFDLSTLREPFRVEGKKTMGFEIFEQATGAQLPEVIVFPTGGGTGVLGLEKAFDELRSLGWLERIPKLVAVQAEHCAPIVRAFRDGDQEARPWKSPTTIAPGLLVPSPFDSARVLTALRRTRGAAVTVTDRAIFTARAALAAKYGISVSPEGAAPFASLPKLIRDRIAHPGEHVLLYSTGTGRFSAKSLVSGSRRTVSSNRLARK